MDKDVLMSSSHEGLRTKLIVNYLILMLGVLLLLTVAVLISIQNYFNDTQRQALQMHAQYAATQYEDIYRYLGKNWDHLPGIIQQEEHGPSLAIIVDTHQYVKIVRVPEHLSLSSSEKQVIQQCIEQSLKGKSCSGHFQNTDDRDTFSGFYLSQPLYDNGHIIGAMFFAEPEFYPQGFSPGNFVTNVSRAILCVSVVAAVIVIIFSTIVARRLTRPLISLRQAAEKLSMGDYTQRISLPNTRDEIDQLAYTFNHMAERIEEDVQEMRNQEQQRRDLIANIAHDIATPLTTIQGFSEALADDFIQDKQAQKETAQIIIRETQHLQRLVKEILHLSSLEAGQVPLDKNIINIVEIINATLAIIEPDCTAAGIQMKNEIHPSTLLICVDSDKITQVLFNLFDNARQYTPAGGTITIGCSLNNAQLMLWIRDTGIGIAPQDLPHIFDRFFRADPARTHSAENKGLGLTVAKAIVEAHGGTIHAESTLGQGTTISFTLPSVIG
jgi:two-component system sensor histidine kinase BaeS